MLFDQLPFRSFTLYNIQIIKKEKTNVGHNTVSSSLADSKIGRGFCIRNTFL